MKKIMKLIGLNLVCFICLISVFGCSCSRPMNVFYEIKIKNENLEVTETAKINIKTVITKKFREPADTDCYKKVGDSYELIENSEGVVKCYDVEGNYFEKATASMAEKKVLKEEYPINVNNNLKEFKSDVSEIPKNKLHSLIFDFVIENTEKDTIYIQTLNLNTILNGMIDDESLSKITLNLPNDNLIVLDDKEYYEIDSWESITISISFKNLTTKDFVDVRNKKLKLNIPIVFKNISEE